MERSIDTTAANTPTPTRWTIQRYFTTPGESVWDTVNWVRREAKVTGMSGETIFCQEDVEFPEGWSQTAVNVVTNKYFRGALGSPEREFSVKQLIGRGEHSGGLGDQGGVLPDRRRGRDFPG